MTIKFSVSNYNDIKDLNSDEIKEMINSLNDESLKNLKECLKLKIADLTHKIQNKNSKIKTDKKICKILLNKIWNTLKKETKKESASVFKEISDKIESD